jgi:dTDP-4-amino-4,6-dideoxygalactose transaminase
MAEINAALGLLQLKHVDVAIAARRDIYLEYRRRLAGLKGIRFVGDEWLDGNNFSYCPILITDEHPLGRDEVYRRMREANVFVRRYFYPLISNMSMYRGMPSALRDNLTVANEAARGILCLPIYQGLQPKEVSRVCETLVG